MDLFSDKKKSPSNEKTESRAVAARNARPSSIRFDVVLTSGFTLGRVRDFFIVYNIALYKVYVAIFK